jgi:hypothetical protein
MGQLILFVLDVFDLGNLSVPEFVPAAATQ